MVESEILEVFNDRYLNKKTNNFIFCGFEDLSIIDKIKNKCCINMDENYTDIEYAHNIKIDLKNVRVKDILNYTLNLLRKMNLIGNDIHLELTNKFDLLRFQGILRENNIIVQFVFYNLESLTLEEQMLLNEIYYFNSVYFNANSFIIDENFQTYFLTSDRVLDSRENYTKIKIRQFESDGNIEISRHVLMKKKS